MTGKGVTFGAERRVWPALIGLVVILVVSGCNRASHSTSVIPPAAGIVADPLNTQYQIDDMELWLRDGYFEMPAAPGSAAMVTATVFDTPVYGNLGGGGDSDAALILVYQGGGSGTFYYIVAAVNGSDGYRGTNAIFLGDRVIPRAVSIKNRIVVVDFLDRAPRDPMSVAPTVDITRYAYLDGDRLVGVPADNQVSGWVTIGHEVRSFLPCDGDTGYWVLGQSPALSDLETTYRRTMENAHPYTPLFVVLTGSFMAPPSDGFGADYESVFFANGLIEADTDRHCREEFIDVKAPAAGAVIDSPLSIQGRARGNWFFEGDFPVVLQDAYGNVVASGFVTAQGEWMTKEFVPFTASLSFTKPEKGGRGSLVFKKDNPSEHRELDDEMTIPVFFN